MRFRVYLHEKYGVATASLFIGYMPENQQLYSALQKCGYVLIFKPVLQRKDGKVKGNVDAALVLQAMIDYGIYDQAVIVTSDGDFHCLVKYLNEHNKLRAGDPRRQAPAQAVLAAAGTWQTPEPSALDEILAACITRCWHSKSCASTAAPSRRTWCRPC